MALVPGGCCAPGHGVGALACTPGGPAGSQAQVGHPRALSGLRSPSEGDSWIFKLKSVNPKEICGVWGVKSVDLF